MRETTKQVGTSEDARRPVEDCLELGIRAVFQPIVDLRTRETVAFEALARPPAGSGFESPGSLFVAAKRAGLIAEVDAACRNAAVQGALDIGLAPGVGLFVNVEPDVVRSTPPEHVRSLLPRPGERGLHTVLEVSERALTDRPAPVLAVLQAARAAGWRIAIDDVGANPDALALLPFVRPDVVRIDASLVHGVPGRKAGYVAAAIRAYVERTGAAVLAECIENETNVDHALAFGATLGQGWLFGRPGPVPSIASPEAPIRSVAAEAAVDANASPFGVVRAAGVPTCTATKAVLQSIARGIEADALGDAGRPVVLVAVQHARSFSGDAATRIGELGRHSAFVAVFGVGMPTAPAPRVTGVAIGSGDPLADEWAVVVVGPRHATAFVARHLGTSSVEGEERFEYAVTQNAEVARAAASTLMARCVPSPGVAATA